jgi:hypothetical protein
VLSTGTRPGTLSRTTTVAVGGIAGLLVGVGIAIAWYRARRPVLSLRRALRILPAKDVRVVDGRGGWRGALRRRPRPRARALDDPRVAALLPPEGSRAIAVPGIARRAERGVTRRVLRGRSLPAPASPATLVVIDARTRERDLDLEASQREPEELQMLWVR